MTRTLAIVAMLAIGGPIVLPFEVAAAGQGRRKRNRKRPAAPVPPPVVEPAPEPEIEMAPDDVAPVVDVEPAPPVEPAPAREAWRRFYVRAGGAFIKPLAASRAVELSGVDGAASLAIENGPIAGSGAAVSSAAIFAVTVGYRIRPRIALEVLLGLPFTVQFKATGSLATESIAPMALGIPTGVPALGEDLGEAKAAPPVITAVYDLRGRGALRPYVGAGVSVLFAYDAKVTNPILTEVGSPTMSVAPAPGLVAQVGVDVRLARRIYARLDVKYIAFMLARAEVANIQVRTPGLPLFDTVDVGTANMDVWVNPLTVQLGIGTDF